MGKLYQFICHQPVKEVIDLHVLWGKLFGLPASVRERLEEMAQYQVQNESGFDQARFDILNKVVRGESIEMDSLSEVVSGESTKWDLLPWLTWQYENLKDYIMP
ncbi:hypothetical protein VIC_001233 [Vibrio coralliilyticus ATCC BAA-450]|nr:hypothetical protein VIC_001233 [Vibrio coralliilyticus ATCC BAA-450]